MDDIETIIEALLNMEGPEPLLPGGVEAYRSALEDYSKIETVGNVLGQKVECQPTRLNQEVKRHG